MSSATALAKDEDFAGGMVVFARDASLWRTDPRGQGPAVELVALPGKAHDVRMIRTLPAGKLVLFDHAGAWWWAELGDAVAQPTKLPCADAPARFVEDGTAVMCADGDGHALLVRLGPGTARSFPVPAEGARLVRDAGKRALIWADERGVWRATLAKLRTHHRLAAEGPKRGFLPSPDGTRAVGVYAGEYYKKKEKLAGDVTDGFALDGKAARRMLYHDTTRVIDWSWDSQWILSQDDKEGACITRPVGGQYKCWKGYTAVSIAPDGRWALVLGKRAASAEPEEEVEESEPEEGGAEDDEEEDAAPPVERHSLYRVYLDGPRSKKPSLVETDIDGAGALWLPTAP